MIKYTCPKCAATLESPSSMAGRSDQCPQCGHACEVPLPKKASRRNLLAFAGIAGLLIATTLVIVFVLDLGPGAPRSRSESYSAHTPVAEPRGDPGVASRPLDGGTDDAAPKGGKTPQDAHLSPEQLFEKASPAVVYIVVRDREFKPLGLGSGFFVDANGLIVTNYHVIKGAEFATARLSSGATVFVDGVVATDPDSDLAILTVSGAGFAFLKSADGPLPKIGAAVYAIGNPQGLENTFSGGMVSGHREIKEGFTAIQVTTPISPGSSGGPLLNASGEVVGVTTAYFKEGQNLNFAVPAADVRALMLKRGPLKTLASAGGLPLGNNATAQLDKAWEAIRNKDLPTAAKILTSLRKEQPNNPSVHFALGFLHTELGNNDLAIESYKVAIELNPNLDGAYFNMGPVYCRLNKNPEAIACYKKVIALVPYEVEAYVRLGLSYRIARQYQEAVNALKTAVALDPNNVEAHSSLGKAYEGQNQYPEAITTFKTAISIAPKDFDLYYELNYAYVLSGQTAEGIQSLKDAISRFPNAPDLYSYLGDAYAEAEQHEDAVKSYNAAIALKPDNAGFYFCKLADEYEKTGRFNEAINAFNKWIASVPGSKGAERAKERIADLRLRLNRKP